MRLTSVRNVTLIIAFVLLVTLPYWVTGTYYINVSSQILYYAIFAIGLNILVGYGGLVSLGHAGLFGITAYAVGYLLQLGFGHAAAMSDRAASSAAIPAKEPTSTLRNSWPCACPVTTSSIDRML